MCIDVNFRLSLLSIDLVYFALLFVHHIGYLLRALCLLALQKLVILTEMAIRDAMAMPFL